MTEQQQQKKPADIHQLSSGEDEELSRIRVAAKELANETAIDRSYLLPKRAKEIGVRDKVLKDAVRAVLSERSQHLAAERLAEERAAEERAKEQCEQQKAKEAEAEKERQRAKDAAKIAEQERIRAAKEAAEKAEQERRRAEKEAEKAKQKAQQKAKDKAKGFGDISRLPRARHEQELKKLAAQLDEDVAALRQEFIEFLGVDRGDVSAERTVPWHDAVDTAELLQACGAKLRKHVVVQDHQLTAAVLWVAHTWLYDYDVPIHSPMLAATSAEPDSGKTTLVCVIGRMCPRFSLNIEMTGPGLYRTVDASKPTLVLTEADDLFAHKRDLKHIVNAGWTRGAKVPRQVNIRGVWTTAYFDVFTPKVIDLLGRSLPRATRTRCIELRMLPKRHDEQVEPFEQLDDAEFAVLRRKFARWAADNAAALKDAKPVLSGLNNRAAMNWRLLLAIAELAGGSVPKQAREAAERLSRSGKQPSDGVRLLTALKEMFASRNSNAITSADIVAELCRDPTGIWVEYHRGGPITQWGVARLLDAYDIHPVSLHPTRRKDFSRQGYKLEQFEDAFMRYLPADPIIQSPPTRPTPKKTKAARRR